jgi:pimeloyl-ACP methyl ester carboxylesterase
MEDPVAAVFLRRLASFSRLIRFDRLVTGASDPAPLERLPPWESYAEELAAVLDEVGSEGAAILVAPRPWRSSISPAARVTSGFATGSPS